MQRQQGLGFDKWRVLEAFNPQEIDSVYHVACLDLEGKVLQRCLVAISRIINCTFWRHITSTMLIGRKGD